MSLRWRIDAAGGALELWVAKGGEAADDAQARDVVESFCWRLECGDPEALRVAVAIEEAVRGYISPALGWEAPVHALERSALGRRLAFKVKSAFWSGLIGAGRWRPTSVGIDEPEDDVLVLTPPEAPPKPESDKEPTWYEVRVVDELGEPIAGLPLVLEVSGKHPLVTDGDGRVRLDGIYPSMGHARIEDLAALRDLVRPRWDQIRPGDWLEPEPDHSFIPLRGSEPILRSVFAETLHTLVIQPWVIRARLIGMYFDTSKCFLLPSALGDITKLKKLYDEYPDSEILVVGHTDKTGDPSYNDPLSLERADSVAAYMHDDFEAWRAWYRADKPWEKRWGAKEDHDMLQGTSGYDARPQGESEITWFQSTRGLDVDGWAGEDTRKQLIKEYMAKDGTTLPASATLSTHGCGETFPFTDEELVELDLVNADPNQRDRRVELYFFDRDLGVQPPPPGKISSPGSLEYPEWRKRAQETHDFDLVRQEVLLLRLHDEDSRPWPHVHARVFVQGEEQHQQADSNGWIRVNLPDACGEVIRVDWGGATAADKHPFSHEVYVECSEGSDSYQATARLHNLGHPRTLALDVAVKRFQADYEVDCDPEPLGLLDGELPSATRDRLEQIYSALDCNATPG